ncbi:MAG: hypothetical protein ABSG91_14960 [Syntrophobacteraceae bacterium]|jgi:hypothetical protein
MPIHNCKAIQERAERLRKVLTEARTRVGKGDRTFTVDGVDPNEVKKIYAYLCTHNNLAMLRDLLQILPTSSLCRTNRTAGYYQNIRLAFDSEGVYDLSVADAKAIIGWACRLL